MNFYLTCSLFLQYARAKESEQKTVQCRHHEFDIKLVYRKRKLENVMDFFKLHFTYCHHLSLWIPKTDFANLIAPHEAQYVKTVWKNSII